jgi:ribokinase
MMADDPPSAWALRSDGRRGGPIVVAGNLSLDDTVNPQGEVLDAPGGDALYAAIGARIWGAEVMILTLAGEDYPEAYLARMRELGIGTDLIRRAPGPTVHYRVVDDAAGERTYLHLTDEDRLAATSPAARDYAQIGSWAWLHLAAMPIDAQRTGIAAAREAGVPVSLDPHEEYILGYEPLVRDLVRGTAFMPSELEVNLLFPDLADLVDELERATAAAARLEKLGPAWSAIKIGARGSLLDVAGRLCHVPALSIEVVDQIGAGDAFCGGLIAGLVATSSLLAGAACGAVSAAHAITHAGAFPTTSWPSIDELVDQAGELLAGRFDGDGDRAFRLLQSGVAAST